MSLHYLDAYATDGELSEYRRVDTNIQQALAWKRLERRSHLQDDSIWIKHECFERRYELTHNAGYLEAH